MKTYYTRLIIPVYCRLMIEGIREPLIESRSSQVVIMKLATSRRSRKTPWSSRSETTSRWFDEFNILRGISKLSSPTE